MKELELEEISQILQLIDNKDEAALSKLIPNLYYADVAELLEELPLEQRLYLYSLLPGSMAADVLMELDEDDRKEILDLLTSEEIAANFVEHMDTDDAADLLQELDEERQDDILSYVEDVEQAGEIIDLLRYDEDTAGGVMRKEMMVVNENWSMPKCLEEIRKQAEELEEIYYVYVVNDDYRLKGVLPIKKLITQPSVSKVKHVMRQEPVFLHEDDNIEEVINAFDKYDLVAMPVVDTIERLVGVITVDDVVDEMREQHEKDYQLASGLSQDVESSDSVIQQTAARLPWLLLGMVGGIFNSALLGRYESIFARIPAVSLYIPMIGATGGNVGMQSSAIIVQDLATNIIKPGSTAKLLAKEFAVSLVNASIISLVVFIYNYFVLDNMLVTLSVSLSLFAVVIFASLFGTLAPLLLNRLKMDPARATGPFITIMNDLIGMFVYMAVTQLLFNHFGT